MTGAVLSLIIMAVIAMVLYFVMTVLERLLFRWRAESSTSSIVPM